MPKLTLESEGNIFILSFTRKEIEVKRMVLKEA